MPALFAYLIAVGLLLGGGYGALSWLAAPEPVKVAAKAKPRPPPQTSSLAVSDSGQVASGTNNPSAWSQSETSVAGVQPESSGLQKAHQSRAANAANAEASLATASKETRQPVLAVPPRSASNAQPVVSTALTTAATPVKRPHPREARSRSEKPAFALMTLRTIEFADGRRVTRLIPYRGSERALAFKQDE
jgi:hypothetical protein